MDLQFNSNINKKTKQEFSKQWNNEIGRFLPTNLEKLAVTTGEIQRKRGVKTATDVLKMLLLYAVSGMSFKLLALCADALGIAKISDTAWRKKMLHAKEWLREILNHSLTTLVSSNLSDQSRDVYLIDGSTIRQEGKKQKQVRIHMSYNLKKNCMQEIKVTDHHGAESFSHYTMKKNDIFMADSGYGTSSNLLYAVEHQADVICRFSPNHMKLWNKEGARIDMYSFLKKQKKDVVEFWCYTQYQRKNIFIRVIASKIPEEKIDAAQKRKKKKSHKYSGEIKNQTLEYSKWTILVTTLGVEYGKEEILHLYRSRWKVELLFKRLKQNLKIQTARAGSETYLVSLVYLWLILWSVVEKQSFLAEKYWIAEGKERENFNLWNICAYYYRRSVVILNSGWSLFVDPFDMNFIEKYLKEHKRIYQNLEHRLCILSSYIGKCLKTWRSVIILKF